ncbi:nuclear transport factor 2 family protein [Lysobacter sp. S4-A87]|uniref:nuclear transport factor 2 family protein n=1 Tax=Lysobacter sp. S4-A87 TaxID=2925843 RepID=UPI001F52F4E7|nr:nuclear transport factor 2 family protein [Lysobacter sp. S4-A87]UNK49698.1 nuclear transport factor 2 family protein [Lysobacter sp. S4-A87]
MRSVVLASSLALGCIAAGAAFAKSPQPSVPSPAAAEQGARAASSPAANEAVQAVNAFIAALAGGRLEAARQLMTPDAIVLANGQVLGVRDGYLNGPAKGDVAALGNFQRELLRRDVKVGANLGWVVSETSLRPATGAGQVVTETMLVVRTNEGWKIAHIHWSGRRAG